MMLPPPPFPFRGRNTRQTFRSPSPSTSTMTASTKRRRDSERERGRKRISTGGHKRTKRELTPDTNNSPRCVREAPIVKPVTVGVDIRRSVGLCSCEITDRYVDLAFIKERVLGSGDFGTVMSVRSRADGRRFALKCFHSQTPAASWTATYDALSLAEVRKHKQLGDHPNIAKFCRAWKEGGQLYMLMELCEESLSTRYKRRGRSPTAECFNVLFDMLSALDYLHCRGFAHLDVKPANILVAAFDVYKLADFSVMSKLDEPDSVLWGDNRYAAPERFHICGLATRASDLFSLGLTIVEIALFSTPSSEMWTSLRAGSLPEDAIMDESGCLLPILRSLLSPDCSTRQSIWMTLCDHEELYDAYTQRARFTQYISTPLQTRSATSAAPPQLSYIYKVSVPRRRACSLGPLCKARRITMNTLHMDTSPGSGVGERVKRTAVAASKLVFDNDEKVDFFETKGMRSAYRTEIGEEKKLKKPRKLSFDF